MVGAVLARLRAGDEEGQALADTVLEVPPRRPPGGGGGGRGGARLNLLHTSGDIVTATAWGDTVCGTHPTGGGTVVASEPYDDDPHWREVPRPHPGSRREPHDVMLTHLPAKEPGDALTGRRHPYLRVAPNATVSPFRLTRTLPEDAADGRPARRRPRGPDPSAPGRCRPSGSTTPGQRAVRGDHRALPRLPDPAERESCAPAPMRSPRRPGARTLVELGSVSSEKTRQPDRRPDPAAPLRPRRRHESALALAVRAAWPPERPGLECTALIARLSPHALRPVARHAGPSGCGVPRRHRRQPAVPAERAPAFLASVRALHAPATRCCPGTDLVKDERVLVRAYDDAAGVTAAFNRTPDRHQRELGPPDFDPDAFDHVALWDARHEWILEMRLRSRTAQTVEDPPWNSPWTFAGVEDLRTEVVGEVPPGRRCVRN
ncbi:hypothetical protein GCM10023238_00430 [Streptomyces heliomycini]